MLAETYLDGKITRNTPMNDIILNLLCFECFQYVAWEFIEEDVKNSFKDKSEFKDIKELCNHIVLNYI